MSYVARNDLACTPLAGSSSSPPEGSSSEGFAHGARSSREFDSNAPGRDTSTVRDEASGHCDKHNVKRVIANPCAAGGYVKHAA